jgi:hypothetical protein
LLALNRPTEAQHEFEAALKIYPGRFRALYGAALAAEQSGDKAKARKYYLTLNKQTAKADGSREELARVREFRVAKGAEAQLHGATKAIE